MLGAECSAFPCVNGRILTAAAAAQMPSQPAQYKHAVPLGSHKRDPDNPHGYCNLSIPGLDNVNAQNLSLVELFAMCCNPAGTIQSRGAANRLLAGHVWIAFECCTRWLQGVTSFLAARSSKTSLRITSSDGLVKAPEAVSTSNPSDRSHGWRIYQLAAASAAARTRPKLERQDHFIQADSRARFAGARETEALATRCSRSNSKA